MRQSAIPGTLTPMKIAEETADRLVVEDNARFLQLVFFLVGAGAVAAAALNPEGDGPVLRLLIAEMGLAIWAVGWWYAPSLKIAFERSQSRITVEHKRLFMTRAYTLSFDRLERAMWQSNWSDGTRMTRLALVMDDGPIPMEFGFGGADRAPIAKTINDWLESP